MGNPIAKVLRQTLLKLGSAGSQDDAELLGRFVAQRDEAAFAEIVRRHGPMVLRLCQRALRHAQDAEDAFQATFVVLARKAPTVKNLGGWLHGVAHRVALRSRARRNQQEARRNAWDAQRAAASENGSETDWRAVLDEEISRLPAKHRAVILLCCLEGQSTAEAARQLQCPPGTVMSRLFHARDHLRGRLARRGVTLTSAALAAILDQEAVPAAMPSGLQASAVQGGALVVAGQATTGVISDDAGALADATIHAMATSLRRKLAVVLLGVALLVAGSTAALLFRPTTSLGKHQATFQPQGGMVVSVTFSADSKLLAIGDTTTTVAIWDVARRKKRITLKAVGPEAYATGMAFSPDGSILAVGYQDRLVRLWDVATGNVRGVLRGHAGIIKALAFAPDRQTLASVAWLEPAGELILWDLTTSRPRATNPLDPVAYLAFSPDGATLLAVGSNGLSMWDVASAKEKPIELPEHFRLQRVRPDGTRTGQMPAAFSCCGVSPDGTAILLRRPDRVVVLWNLASREERPLFQMPPNSTNRALLAREGQRVAVYSYLDPRNTKRLVHVIDFAAGKVLIVPQQLHSSQDSWDLQLSPDGKFLMTRELGGNGVQVWDLEAAQWRDLPRVGQEDRANPGRGDNN